MNIIKFILNINKTNLIISEAINMERTYNNVLDYKNNHFLNCTCYDILKNNKELNINTELITFMKNMGFNLRQEQFLTLDRAISVSRMFDNVSRETLNFNFGRHYGKNQLLYLLKHFFI